MCAQNLGVFSEKENLIKASRKKCDVTRLGNSPNMEGAKIANDPLNMGINFSIDFRCLRVAFDWFVLFFFFFDTKISIICGIRLLACFSRFL